jgi:hypothetical protein
MLYNVMRAWIASFVRRGAMRIKAVPSGAVGIGADADAGRIQTGIVSE